MDVVGRPLPRAPAIHRRRRRAGRAHAPRRALSHHARACDRDRVARAARDAARDGGARPGRTRLAHGDAAYAVARHRRGAVLCIALARSHRGAARPPACGAGGERRAHARVPHRAAGVPSDRGPGRARRRIDVPARSTGRRPRGRGRLQPVRLGWLAHLREAEHAGLHRRSALSVRARRPRGLSRHRRRASRVGERRRQAWREGDARASERSHRRPRDGTRLARRVPGRDLRRAHSMTRLGAPLLIGAVAAALAAVQPINDTDVWWHLATGRETLAQGIVRSDLFSWTVRGAPVSTDQWLGQVALYLSYAVAGWWGVALLRVVLIGALITIVALDASGRVKRPLAVVLATIPALPLTRAVAVDRPELAGFVLFAALLYLLRRGRAGSWRALVACTALVGVWANVHGSFALGAVLTGFVCIEGALRDVARRREYIAVALAQLAVTLESHPCLPLWSRLDQHLLCHPRS